MILEQAVLDVIPEKQHTFEATFKQAEKIIITMPGYISHNLHKCIENNNRYLLLVEWQSLEDHTVGFRQSAEYQDWRNLLHHYYEPFPTVEHYRII